MARQGSICVVGLGKLGAPMAAVFAYKGYRVFGVDPDPQALRRFRDAHRGSAEPGLSVLLDANIERCTVSDDLGPAIEACGTSFVIVPTESRADHAFSNDAVIAAVTGIATCLKETTGYHLVVVCSTVMPGSMDGDIRQCLQGFSGRTVGRDVGLCYAPEFLALGNVVKGLVEPEMAVIGESDAEAGDRLAEIYRTVHENDPPVFRMTAINAEVVKVALNAYMTTKISFANMVGELCEKLPGGDAGVVCRALGADTRIGSKYLNPALAYAGPCFPRDAQAFVAVCERAGTGGELAQAADTINARQTTRLVERIFAHAPKGARIAVLGLAFKPGTEVITSSVGIAVAAHLAAAGYAVVVSDPAAIAEARERLGDRVMYADDATSAIIGAAVAVVTTPWPQYATLLADAEWPRDAPLVLLDPWNVVKAAGAGRAVTVIDYGRSPSRVPDASPRRGDPS